MLTSPRIIFDVPPTSERFLKHIKKNKKPDFYIGIIKVSSKKSTNGACFKTKPTYNMFQQDSGLSVPVLDLLSALFLYMAL